MSTSMTEHGTEERLHYKVVGGGLVESVDISMRKDTPFHERMPELMKFVGRYKHTCLLLMQDGEKGELNE